MVGSVNNIISILVAIIVVNDILQLSVYGSNTTRGKKTEKRPNFIILFADDIGWGDIGVNWNPSGVSDTPNIDALARNGVRFTDFHAGASVCTPSRASLLTSRLGLRTGVVKNFEIRSKGGLPLNETVFAETFKAAGYRTGIIGKWHLGVNGHYHPNYRGFDYYYGLPYSNDMGCVDNPGYDLPTCGACPKDNLWSPKGSKHVDQRTRFKHIWHVVQEKDDPDASICHPLSALPLFENTKIIEQPVDLFTLSERYANKANEFITNRSKSDQPFLLYVAFAHMHTPLTPNETFTHTSRNGVYGDTLGELDDVIGKIVKSVKDAGKERDTLIWFMGDNGPWAVKCEFGGNQGPYLGSWQHEKGGGGSSAKKTLWEGGHREPAFAYWPGHIPAGHVSNSLLSALDVFPTIASLARIAMPTDRRFDGIDVTDVLFNETEIRDRVLYHPNSGASGTIGQLDAVRLGNYKAIYQTGGEPDCGGTIGPPKRHDPPLIFDLLQDPSEKTPLDQDTAEYMAVYFGVESALKYIMEDIKRDNTSIADYSWDPSAEPCCNTNHVACRCYG